MPENDTLTTQTEPDSSPAQDAQTAAPSPAQDAQDTPPQAPNLLELAKHVHEEHVAKESASSPENPPVEGQDKEKAPDKKPEPKEDKEPLPTELEREELDKKLPFDKHPRWREVRTQLSEVKKQVSQLEPLAAAARYDQEFRQKAGIDDETYQGVMNLLALRKTDRGAFRQQLMNVLHQEEIEAGNRLSPDLQKRVDDMVLDPETAKELQTARRLASEAQARLEAQKQTAEVSHIDSLKNHANSVEQRLNTADPSYKHRAQLVQNEFARLYQANQPQTPEEVEALVQQADATVVKAINAHIPAPQERRVLKHVGSLTAPAPNGAPKTNLEKVKAMYAERMAAGT